jgi:hypothetical protein
MRPTESDPASIARSIVSRATLGITDNDDLREMWANSRYIALVERWPDGSVVHISYRRRDRKAFKDWRDAQMIKNDIAGPDLEAVELYPAITRLMQTNLLVGALISREFAHPTGSDQPVGCVMLTRIASWRSLASRRKVTANAELILSIDRRCRRGRHERRADRYGSAIEDRSGRCGA